jgi:hypothetical protein
VATALLVTAVDAELPGMLKGVFHYARFTNIDDLRAVLAIKPGSMVIVLDHAHASVVSGLHRADVRAVALISAQSIPVIFRTPIIAVVERPLVARHVVEAIRKALTELHA